MPRAQPGCNSIRREVVGSGFGPFLVRLLLLGFLGFVTFNPPCTDRIQCASAEEGERQGRRQDGEEGSKIYSAYRLSERARQTDRHK